MEAVEGYLFTLDHMYRVLYYHHAVRAATTCLVSTIKRAVNLYRDGDKAAIPAVHPNGFNPLREFVESGEEIPIVSYMRTAEFQLWQYLEIWRDIEDKTLSDLASRVLDRNLFKTIEVRDTNFGRFQALVQQAQDKAVELIPHVDQSNVDLYVIVDEPERTSYKTYSWTPESPLDSIWLVGRDIQPHPIEVDERSRIIEGLRKTRFFPRLVIPREVRDALREDGH